MPKKFTREILTAEKIKQLRSPQKPRSKPAKSMSNEEFKTMLNASVKRIMQQHAAPQAPPPKPTPKEIKQFQATAQQQVEDIKRKYAQPSPKEFDGLSINKRYQLARNILLAEAGPNRSELIRSESTKRFVYELQRNNIECYAVQRYSPVMELVRGRKEGCFIISNPARNGAIADIWVDLSQCQAILEDCRHPRIRLNNVIEAAIAHEVGHIEVHVTFGKAFDESLAVTEWMAWSKGEEYYKRHCGRYYRRSYNPPDMEIYRTVRKACIGY